MRIAKVTCHLILTTAALIGLSGCRQEGSANSSPVRLETTPPAASESQMAPPTDARPTTGKFGLQPSVKTVGSDIPGEFEITYNWSLTTKREMDFRVFVHFTDDLGQIKFQNDHDPEPPTSQWEPGMIEQGPHRVMIPKGLEGTFGIRMGLYQHDRSDIGASARDELDGQDDGEMRIIVGHLLISDGKAEFKAVD